MKGRKIDVFSKGDIYYCDLGDTDGSVQRGYRPVLRIQNNTGNLYSPTLIVTPITTIIKKEHMPMHVIIGKSFGLSEDSMVMLEQIHTIDKIAQIGEYVGRVDELEMLKIDAALKVSVGLL